MRPKIHANNQEMGSDIFAGILNTIIKIKLVNIGTNAIIGSKIDSIQMPSNIKNYLSKIL